MKPYGAIINVLIKLQQFNLHSHVSVTSFAYLFHMTMMDAFPSMCIRNYVHVLGCMCPWSISLNLWLVYYSTSICLQVSHSHLVTYHLFCLPLSLNGSITMGYIFYPHGNWQFHIFPQASSCYVGMMSCCRILKSHTLS